MAPAPAWGSAVARSLDDCAARAARPAVEAVPAAANAVVFADRSELLACAARDWCRGALFAHWWWAALGLSAPERVAAALAAEPQVLPAVFARLAAAGDLEVFVTRLCEAEVVRLVRVVAAAFGVAAVAEAGLAEPAIRVSGRRGAAHRRGAVGAARRGGCDGAAVAGAAVARRSGARPERASGGGARAGLSRRRARLADGGRRGLAGVTRGRRAAVAGGAGRSERAEATTRAASGPALAAARPRRPDRRRRVVASRARRAGRSRRHRRARCGCRAGRRVQAGGVCRGARRGRARGTRAPRGPSAAARRQRRLGARADAAGRRVPPRLDRPAARPLRRLHDARAGRASRSTVGLRDAARPPAARSDRRATRSGRCSPRSPVATRRPPGRGFRPPRTWRVPHAWLAPFGPAGTWRHVEHDGRLLLVHPAGFAGRRRARARRSRRELRRYGVARAPADGASRSSLAPRARPLGRRTSPRTSARGSRVALGVPPRTRAAARAPAARARPTSPTRASTSSPQLADLPIEVRLAGPRPRPRPHPGRRPVALRFHFE